MTAGLVAGLRELVAEETRVSTSPSVLDHHGRPVRGGISLDLTRMDRILAVYPEEAFPSTRSGARKERRS